MPTTHHRTGEPAASTKSVATSRPVPTTLEHKIDHTETLTKSMVTTLRPTTEHKAVTESSTTSMVTLFETTTEHESTSQSLSTSVMTTLKRTTEHGGTT